MKAMQFLKLLIRSIGDKIRRSYSVNNSVWVDIAAINLGRVFYLAIISMMVNMAVIAMFNQGIASAGSIESRWRRQIILCHLILFVIMAVLAGISLRLKNSKKISKVSGSIQYFAITVLLIFGILFVFADQAVTTSITPILIACFLAGGILLIRPSAAFTIYGITAMSFYQVIGLTHINQAVLLSNRVNGIACIGLGFCMSLVTWKANVSNILQKRYITQQQQELAEKNRELELLAFNDPMTGLFSRRKLEELLLSEISRLQRYGHETCIVLMDIDNFKQINDKFGHPAGDMVIRRVAALLMENVRETDYVARWGGDEFLLLLPYASLIRASIAAEKLRAIIEKEIVVFNGSEVQLTSSFGITNISRGRNDSLKHAYANVDKALYIAKEKGRNRIEAVS